MEKAEEIAKTNRQAYYETKRHADTMFAFNIYPCTIPYDFSFVPLHWQDSVEIIFIKQGAGVVNVDMENYAAAAGDVFIVLPGHIHGISSLPNERMEYENIIFDMNFLGASNIDVCSTRYWLPILEGEIKLTACLRKGDCLYDEVVGCLEQIDALCDRRPMGYELGVKGLLLFMFSILFQKSIENGTLDSGKRGQEKIKYVLGCIEQRYQMNLTVREMAEECGYSESHFMRWFKENTGFGFNAYLIEYRLSRAVEALHNSDETVINIAGNTGFDNLSNFNRLFKKRFLMTPTEFRNQNKRF